MFKSLLTLAIAGTFTTFAHAATLEERVSELEANQSVNIFTFGGTMLTRYDDISAQQAVGTATPFDYKHLDYWRMKFSLDANANVSKYIKVYSRYSMSKFMTQTMRQDAGGTTLPFGVTDTTAADSYASSAVYVEKAYADLLVPDTNLIFSVGRLPTVDGSPYDYYDNRARLGTYPMMSYDTPLDGVSLTYRMDDFLPKNQKLALRAIYTPFTQLLVSSPNGAYQSPATSGGAGAYGTGSNLNPTIDGYAAQVDYSLLDSVVADNFNVILQYMNLNPIGVGNDLSIAVAETTLSVDMKGIAGSRFDLAASVLGNQTHSRGLYTAAGNVGYGTASNDQVLSATTSLLTLRYRFTGWHIGGEYLMGGKNNFVYQGAEKDLTSFYGTPGTAYHLFITKNFTDLLSLRLGYMQQNYKYNPITVGPTADSDKKIATYYANMRLDF